MTGRTTPKKLKKLSSVFMGLGLGTAVLVVLLVVFMFVTTQFTPVGTNPAVIIAIVAVFLIAAGLIVGWYITRKYARPLEDLTQRADRFASGDYGVDFEIDNGPSEVVAMGKSLEAITHSTRAALGELHAEEQRQAQFVSDVSHEIRTPLTGIRGTAETMLENDVPPALQEQFLENIIGECDRLTRLANDLLALQRIEATADELDLSRINLRELVDSTVGNLTPLLEDREVEVSVTGEAPDVLGNADQLTQVMVNLVENASRFAKKHVHIELTGLKGNSVVTVSDDGPGFGDIDPSRLFDRFYRADLSRQSATGGAGLGLAIVKSIVEAHDGTVEAFNIPSGGACFVVAIPSVGPQ